MTLTMEGVLALAPDDASAKAARGLTAPTKWPLLGTDGTAAWGECQGSGSKPYQAQVDLTGPVFRCSCPSRKFPCKHGLALLLIRAQSPELFTDQAPPAWVSEWLSSRAEKAQKKEERQQEKATAPADLQAAAKREAKRWDRIDTAIQELQRWLTDQLQHGLGSIQGSALDTWNTMAARLVDAQAPGLGQRVRDAAASLKRGNEFIESTLRQLGELQLLSDAVVRRADLPAALLADLRVALGWPLDKAEVLSQGERLTDTWTVMGVVNEDRDGKLTERRVWLHGQRSSRRALLLEHAFGGRGFDTAWSVGTAATAQLAYFPGHDGMRALLVERSTEPQVPTLPSTNAKEEWWNAARQVAACPWSSLQTLCLAQAVVLREQEATLVASGATAWPVALNEADTWTLIACTGGHAHMLFGEWNGLAFSPTSAWSTANSQLLWQQGMA
ncbi:MAG: SWIM zinc finger family protein [Rhizobacter sp.]